VVIVHSPRLEREYFEKGFFVCREPIAYNFFVLVGPRDDPANVSGLGIVDAFRRIAEARATFVSRGDLSGTHMKEMELWRVAIGRVPDPAHDEWYVSVGAGMGQTLLVANKLGAYTLSDLGTWLRYREAGLVPNLRVLVDGRHPVTLNVYSVIIARDSRAARAFVEYMLTRGQEVLAGFKIGDVTLFTPITQASEQVREWIREVGGFFGPRCR